MTSSRRVAFSFVGILAACGAVLLFSMSSAKGQGVPSPVSNTVSNSAIGGPSGSSVQTGPIMSTGSVTTGAVPVSGAPSGTPMPSFSQTIGVSPVQIGKKSILLVGESGGESIDLQRNNLYGLLSEAGANHPLVLDPVSGAKPSFILERLIVLSLTGGAGSSTSGSTSGSGPTSPDPRSSGGGETGGTTQAPAGPNAAQRTISQVRALVNLEISRGSGRIGGAHRRKLQLLRDSIVALEQANTIGGAVSNAISGAQGSSSGPSTGGSGDASKTDPREFFYGRARLLARQADRYVPVSY